MQRVLFSILFFLLSGPVLSHENHAKQEIIQPVPLASAEQPHLEKNLTEVIFWLPPAHPVTVHFSIAFLVLAGVVAFISLLKPASRILILFDPLLYLGALTSILAMATGLYFEEYTPHHHGGLIDPIMETHEILGITIAVMSVVLSLLNWISARKNFPSLKKWIFGGTILVALLISFTSHLGGILVHYFKIAKP